MKKEKSRGGLRISVKGVSCYYGVRRVVVVMVCVCVWGGGGGVFALPIVSHFS